MSEPRYNPNTPAHNERMWREKYEAVTLCGKNRGPHDYIPILWRWKKIKDKDGTDTGEKIKTVSEFMCRVCFFRVKIDTLVKNFPEVTL